jgi:O-methyltransferase
MSRAFSRFINRLADRLSYDLRRTAPSDPDITADELRIWEAVQPYTMTSLQRIVSLIRAVRFTAEQRIPGAIVECGVWRGGSMMAVAMTLLLVNDERDLYLFDTYSGMSMPTSHDATYYGQTASNLLVSAQRTDAIVAEAGILEVRQNLARTGYPESRLHFVQGPVEETVPRLAPPAISLLRLDTDWYESTRHELTHLYPRLAPNGIVIIDDYGHWAGARQAVDEFTATLTPTPFLHRIDYTARAFTKSPSHVMKS